MSAKFEFQALFNDDQVIKSLRRIEKQIDSLENKGDRSFRNIGKSASLSGVKIGATSGIVQELTRRFIDLGAEAVRAFAQIISGSTEVAKEFQTTETVFKGIFQGSEPIAAAVFDRLRAKSRELGADITEIGKSFLPFVESIEQVEKIAELVPSLVAKSPEQGIGGARIALIEALAGDFISLKKRFELGSEAIDNIKTLQKELGNTEGLLQGLDIELKRLGLSAADLAGTLERRVGRVQEFGGDFQAALGEPIVAELTEQFDALGDVLEERGDDFELIASAFGDVVANIVEFIGTNLTEVLANLDTEQALELADSLFEAVEAGKALAIALTSLEVPNDFLSALDDAATFVTNILKNIRGINTIGLQITAGEAARQKSIEEQGGSFAAFRLGISGLTGEQKQTADDAARAARKEIGDEFFASLEEQSDALDKNREKTAERRTEQEKSTVAEEQFADALLASQRRAEEIESAFSTIQGLEAENQEKLQDILQKGITKRLEDEIRFSEKREDIARKTGQRLEDAERNNERAIAAAGTGLERDEARLLRKQGQEKIKIERDLVNDRIDVETRFRERLREIQQDFLESSEEAERSRDAIAFLRAVRTRDRAIDDAQVERQGSLAEAEKESQEKRAILRADNEFELQELKIKNQERLEDLRTRLDQELDDINRAKERELEAADIAEQRKTEALEREIRRRVDAEKLALEESLANFTAKLDAEVQAVIQSEAAKTAAVEAETAKQKKIIDDLNKKKSKKKKAKSFPTGPKQTFDPNDFFQSGGAVTQGNPVIVGDGGPEVFTPSVNGRILPNQRVSQLPLTQALEGGNTDNSISATVNQSLLDPSEQKAIMRSIARLEAQRVIEGVIRR